MQNLSATLALVDRDQPAHSPLLTVPRSAHGGMEQAVFGPRDDRLLMPLVEWVALVTRDSDQVAATENSAPDLGEQLAGAAALDPPPSEDSPTLRPQTPIRYGAVLRPVEPRDEFDPEIFNRRYARDGQPPK